MFLICLGVVVLAFLGWMFAVAIRRDLHGRSVDPHGSFDPARTRAESQARIYTGR
ncbi:MAG TPA: hypothetical protein VFU36_09620 [Jatrophihabitans sp.]|nr:hypothetical protein [Jatrophihabitans sp.]